MHVVYHFLFLFVFLSSPLLAMEDESQFRNLPHMRVEKQSEVEAMFAEYHAKKRPVALAVCCGCNEIPDRIKYIFPFYSRMMELVKQEYERRGGPKAKSEDEFHAEFKEVLIAAGAEEYPNFLSYMCGPRIPFVSYDPTKSGPLPQESWISLDLYLTDRNVGNGGPHVRMDVSRSDHWQELSDYLSLNKVKFRTIVITGYPPRFESPILISLILPLLEEGGQLVFRATHFSPCIAESHFAPINYDDGTLFLSCVRPISTFIEDVREFHLDKTVNLEALINKTMKWIGNEEDTDLEKRLQAKVYANRVACFNPKLYEALVNNNLPDESFPTDLTQPCPLFTKSEVQLRREGIQFFREYLDQIQLPINRYRIVATPETAALYGIEEYTYPIDGSYPLVIDAGIRLIFVK